MLSALHGDSLTECEPVPCVDGQTEKVTPSYDLIQATKENPYQARCTIDAVCAALGGWAFDSTDNPTDNNLRELQEHVLKGQPASIGTGAQTDKMTALKLYEHHQYAVMGVMEARDGESCFDIRNPHNKMKRGQAPPMLHRASTLKGPQLYKGKATAEFLLPVKDADLLRGKGSSIITLTMP